jgi:hypothetical protein
MNGCFLYIIVTAHYIKYGSEFVQLLGYGITINPKKRSKQYSDHTGVEQEFCYLFYGETMHIKALESIIKQRVASQCHKIYGEPVEWVSPKAKMSVDEMVTLVMDTIDQQGFPIKLLKDDFLPFNNLEHHRKITVKELNINPNLYLKA